MLRYLLEKEFKQLARNKFMPRIIVFFPFMVLLILPLAANFEVRDVGLSVVDCDRGSYSRRLEERLASAGYFRLVEVTSSYERAISSVEQGKSDIVFEIPEGFEKRLSTEGKADVMISANAVNGTRGGLGSSYLVSVLSDFAAWVRDEWLRSSSRLNAPAFSIIPRYLYNPRLEYPVFMVPALMVMLLAMLCGFLPALNIVGEKENGTIEQMNVTPVRRLPFILSKLIPYWVVGFVVLTICFGVAFVFYGLWPKGSVLTIYLFASLFALAFSGFGLVISNYAKSVQQAMFMMFFFVVTFILMSGLYTPVESMPGWAMLVSRLSPLRYFIQVMRRIYLKGSGVSDLVEHLGALCGFALLFNGWAVLSYRKKS